METQDVLHKSELIEDADCLPERDTGVKIAQCDILANLKSPNKRIIYERDFLLTCEQNPASKLKPSLPATLECISGAGRKSKSELGNPNQTPKKVEVKKEKEPEDTISLRPHSGNFSSGCAANISPTQITQSSYSRFCIHGDEKFASDWDRSRNLNSNLKAQQQQLALDRNRAERERMERDRERIERERERIPRGGGNIRGRLNQQNFWTPDNNESVNDWNRRKNNGNNRDNRGGRHAHRPEREEELPDWFSEGPKNRYETMELRGFQDDDRKDPIKERKATQKAESQRRPEPKLRSNAIEESGNEDEGVPKTPSASMDFNLENFLEMDQISSMLPNSFESESRGSRFSQFFNRNSEDETQQRKPAPAPTREGPPPRINTLFERKSDEAEKPKEVCDLENALRNILLKNPEKEGDKQPVAEPKPTLPPQFREIGAIQKLLDQVKTGPSSGSSRPRGSEVSDTHGAVGKEPNRGSHPKEDAFNIMDIWQQRANSDTTEKFIQMELIKYEQHRGEVISADFLKKHRIPTPPMKMIGVPQVMNMLPREINLLVVNTHVSSDFITQPEVLKYLNLISRGEIDIYSLVQMLAIPNNPHKFLLSAILKMCFKGTLGIKGLQSPSPSAPFPPNIATGVQNMPQRHQHAHHQYMMPQHPHQPQAHQPLSHPQQAHQPQAHQQQGHQQQAHPQQAHQPQPHQPQAQQSQLQQQQVHFPRHQLQMPIGRMGRAEEGPGDQTQKRNGASGSLSFTPTAVMRRMTAPASIPTSTTIQTGVFHNYAHGPVGPQIPQQISVTSVLTTMAQNQGYQQNCNTFPMPFAQPPQIHRQQVQQSFIPFPNNMPLFPMQMMDQVPPSNYIQATSNNPAPVQPKHNFSSIDALAAGGGGAGGPEAHLKNKLSDDLVKLLSGGAGADGAKSSSLPPPPMALSLEEVEQMQFRA